MSERNHPESIRKLSNQMLASKINRTLEADISANVAQYLQPGFINIKSLDDAVEKFRSELEKSGRFTFFTMNLDHLSKLKKYPSFRTLYAGATFVSADGWPIAVLAGHRGEKIRRTTGADIVFPVCRMAAQKNLPVYLFGSTQETLSKASKTLRDLYPGLIIVGELAPPFNFDPRSEFARQSAEAIASSGARLCFVALGAPTQEDFSEFSSEICPQTGFLCVGAALDFIAGTQRRAPRAFQKLGLEWAWRCASSPRRLGIRYTQCVRILAEVLVIRLQNRIAKRGFDAPRKSMGSPR